MLKISTTVLPGRGGIPAGCGKQSGVHQPATVLQLLQLSFQPATEQGMEEKESDRGTGMA